MFEWISVKDKLPDRWDRFLCVDAIGEMYIYLFNFRVKRFQKFDENNYLIPIEGITHWAELPEPPKDKIKPEHYVLKQTDDKGYTIEEAPFRWGGLFHNWNKTAGEWAKELTEAGVPDNENQYKRCFYCEKDFPKDEPLYTVVVTLPDGMKQFKLLCRDCAYMIASAMGCKVIEPYEE
ncbi:MAG: DUF551 domain-containing protein [Clostridiales bacterium]|nr:DUF551 domain-containing protein [Clostridiales bacterium]